MKKFSFTNLIIIFLLLIMISAMIIMIIETKEAKRTCEMTYDEPVFGINGKWHIDEDGEYMCIWINGRTSEEIDKTINHEYLHSLIEHDYNHFCGGY